MRLCCGNSQGLLPSSKNVCFGVHRQGLIKFIGVVNTGINGILWILLIIDIIRFWDSNDRFGPCGESLIYHIVFDKNFENGYRDLLDDEIKKFEDGDFLSELGYPEITEAFCLEQIHRYRYKKEEYEIPYGNLDFADAVLIGSGQYGSVYKLNLTRSDKKGNVTKTLVAVKTIDPKLSDVNCFIALLKEAKLMTYMGNHQHIVDLIGICTCEIRKRTLYIVSELCSYGNLQSYLRSERSAFTDLYQSPGSGEQSSSSVTLDMEAQEMGLNTNHLIRWCYETASGMEYLESRKIVHSDLAARNVLLNADRTVKITDFGLSRRLYSYSVYVKKQSVPLPWKWLAVEALVDLNFSSMSDVWSYGVTCWEIFELGKPPWPDYKVFSAEFVEDVKNGTRMGKPSFCNEEM
ncbi:Vascular endothelial growth factor receptor 3 [Orchesella cincta]|uniref:Vascular endothelial growth factor receptor 3 n=1 Tax=Orchesella cincta TaxID=48709 RepID=A0A1D2MCC9_ORCCI|nr:Vascular endothelial growth factor receptor 3 [Orchesella cincta]